MNDAEALFPVPTAPGRRIKVDEKLAPSQIWKF